MAAAAGFQGLCGTVRPTPRQTQALAPNPLKPPQTILGTPYNYRTLMKTPVEPNPCRVVLWPGYGHLQGLCLSSQNGGEAKAKGLGV